MASPSYSLYIGNKRYSSWSMRPWVLLKALDVPFTEEMRHFGHGQAQPAYQAFSPTAKVPCLHDRAAADGSGDVVVWDSLAIVEYIAERHPAAWPAAPAARAWARSAAAEIHSSFTGLRSECSMNVALRIELKKPYSAALAKDVARLGELFNNGLRRFGGPFLAGADFTAVDAFYAPVASRCQTYGIALEGAAGEYVKRLLEHPAVKAWIDEGIAETEREPFHEDDSLQGRKILEDLAQ